MSSIRYNYLNKLPQRLIELKKRLADIREQATEKRRIAVVIQSILHRMLPLSRLHLVEKGEHFDIEVHFGPKAKWIAQICIRFDEMQFKPLSNGVPTDENQIVYILSDPQCFEKICKSIEERYARHT